MPINNAAPAALLFGHRNLLAIFPDVELAGQRPESDQLIAGLGRRTQPQCCRQTSQGQRLASMHSAVSSAAKTISTLLHLAITVSPPCHAARGMRLSVLAFARMKLPSPDRCSP